MPRTIKCPICDENMKSWDHLVTYHVEELYARVTNPDDPVVAKLKEYGCTVSPRKLIALDPYARALLAEEIYEEQAREDRAQEAKGKEEGEA